MFQHKFSNIYTLITFVLVFSAGYYYTQLIMTAKEAEHKLRLTEVISAQVAAIERHLNHSLSTTYMLELEVQRSQGQLDDFAPFAKGVLQTLGGVASLQLAPKGIVELVYPLMGHEAALGHNLLKSDKRKTDVLRSIDSQALTLSGPFMLRQGQWGMIGRKPIFFEKDGASSFWGFAMAVIYLEDLLSLTELNKLQEKGYQYQLSRIHPDTLKKEVFSRSNHELDSLQIHKVIRVPNSEWQMVISQKTNFTSPLLIGIFMSLLAASLLALLVRRILLEPERLRALVNKQTLQLAHLAFNDELTGLANRRSLTEHLEKSILHSAHTNTCLALMYLDLDNFKYVNDSAGHEVGRAGSNFVNEI